jgi:hypothetical protein
MTHVGFEFVILLPLPLRVLVLQVGTTMLRHNYIF